MQKKTKASYQLPFLGGVTAGTGFGLWGFILMSQLGVLNGIGYAGVIFIGLLLVFLGIALGLPGKRQKRGSK